MENEKIENQKISDDDIEKVAGGAKLHLDTTDKKIPAKVDSIYLTWKEYYKLKKAGIVGKNKTINMHDMGREDLQEILSDTKLTAGNKKLWEVKVDIV